MKPLDSSAGAGLAKLFAIAASVALLAAACGPDRDDTLSADAGLEAFQAAGCAACHGQTGGGGIGPAMGGHVAEQVIRQVRAPIGAMPLFDRTELSDDQLDLIVEFVVGLEPVAHGAGEEEDGGDAEHGDDNVELDPRAVLAGHHWMALSAMSVGDVEQAVHHIGDLAAIVEGEHRLGMEEILVLLETGDLALAQQRTTEMLAGFVPEAGAIDELHVRLALQSLVVEDLVEASEHLARIDDAAMVAAVQGGLDAIESGDVAHAVELLREVVGEDDGDGGGDH